MATLTLHLDAQEQRLLTHRLPLLVNGIDFDLLSSTNVFRDAITGSVMLTPLPFTSAWYNTTAGNYARLKKADYALATPAKWQESDRGIAGNTYLIGLDTNEAVPTLQTFERNQPFWLSFFVQGGGADRYLHIKFAHGNFGSHYEYHIWTDGHVDIYYVGEKVGEGSLIDTSQRWRKVAADDTQDGGKQRTLSGWVDIAIIPCRGREILFLTNQGGGFSWVNENIDENAVGNGNVAITPAGKAAWQVPTAQPVVQLAALKFQESGTLLGPVHTYRYAPATGAVPDFLLYYYRPGFGVDHTITPSLVEEDGSTPFVPNGTRKKARIKIVIATGEVAPFGGRSSPVFYGASAAFPGSAVSTPAGETDLVPFTDSGAGGVQLDVPESPSGVRLTIPLRRPAAIESAGASNIRIGSNRPIKASLGLQRLFSGATEPPSFDMGISDGASRLAIEARDWWKRLESYRLKDDIPFDGLNMATVIGQLVTLTGFPSAVLDVDPVGFDLPASGGAAKGEWAAQALVGDTPADWILRFFETYASTWTLGFYPTAAGTAFRFRAPWNQPTEPALTLYPDEASSTLLGANPARYWPGKYYRFHEVPLECEANDIWLEWRDPRTGKFYQVHYADVLSQNPLLPPGSRPDNHLGEVRSYSPPFNPLITSEESATWAIGVLAQRMTVAPRIAEWESQLLLKGDGVPVWKGDVVGLWGKGEYKVLSFSAQMNREWQAGAVPAEWRKTRYVGEYQGALT